MNQNEVNSLIEGEQLLKKLLKINVDQENPSENCDGNNNNDLVAIIDELKKRGINVISDEYEQGVIQSLWPSYGFVTRSSNKTSLYFHTSHLDCKPKDVVVGRK